MLGHIIIVGSVFFDVIFPGLNQGNNLALGYILFTVGKNVFVILKH